MAKLSVAATIIEEIYNNGKVKANGSKLDYKDFLQYVIIAAGNFLRLQFYEQIQLDGEVGSFLSSMLDVKKFKIKKLTNGSKVVDQDIFITPRNMGVFGVYPVLKCGDDEEADYERAFVRIKPGTERFYTKDKRTDLGIDTFSMRGTKPLLGTDLDEVFVEGIFADDEYLEEAVFPDSVVLAAMGNVFNVTLKMNGYVDMTDDGDPNVKAIKERLQQST